MDTLDKEREGLVIVRDALLTPADISEQSESQGYLRPDSQLQNSGIWTAEYTSPSFWL